MAKLPYEILLRWKDDGTFSSGHTIRRDSVTGQLSQALPIGKDKDFTWPSILGEVNTALAEKAGQIDDLTAKHATEMADKSAELDALNAQLSAAQKERDSAVQALANIDPSIKLAKLDEQKSAALAQVAGLEAEIAKLQDA